jgi:hypothetical protein
MKIILAVLGLVVFAGCQDLGDYPDYTAPKTTTPGTTGTGTDRPADIVPIGGPTVLGDRDLFCETGKDPMFAIEVSSDTIRAWAINSVPKSLYVANDIYEINGKKYMYIKGIPTEVGEFIVPVGIKNSLNWSTVYVTVTVSRAAQSVSQ